MLLLSLARGCSLLAWTPAPSTPEAACTRVLRGRANNLSLQEERALASTNPGRLSPRRASWATAGFRPSPVTSSATGAFLQAHPCGKLDASPSSEAFRTVVRLLERTQVSSCPHTPDLSTSKHDWVPAAHIWERAKQTDDCHPTVLTLRAAPSPAWGAPWSSVCPRSSGSPAVWVFRLQFQKRSAPCFLTSGTSTHSFCCCFG